MWCIVCCVCVCVCVVCTYLCSQFGHFFLTYNFTIERPDSVNLVKPPTTTIEKTMPVHTQIQTLTDVGTC